MQMPFLWLAALILPGALGVTSGFRSEGECQLRAWVCAEDRHQNSVSHGEVRIRVLEPCSRRPVSAGLRLQLDEFFESAPLPDDLHHMHPFMWNEHNFTFSSAITAGAELRGFHVENKWELMPGSNATLAHREVFVALFSVSLPLGHFPVGICPLSFDCSSRDSTGAHRFGRIYRYVANVKFADGITNEVSAGFTTKLIPAVLPADALADGRTISILAKTFDLEKPRRTRPPHSPPRRLGILKEEGVCPRDSDMPKEIPIRVSFPSGLRLVPSEAF
ncbi:hypothetical protein BKA62DRAFT_112646 [Auriculariales sp. MPI-PUGE-AT-0066]|nr:hypothetical protein BKA62DRAFT_112646 [Auriculariales sp. MPI-PUGE-AT-0066]